MPLASLVVVWSEKLKKAETQFSATNFSELSVPSVKLGTGSSAAAATANSLEGQSKTPPERIGTSQGESLLVHQLGRQLRFQKKEIFSRRPSVLFSEFVFQGGSKKFSLQKSGVTITTPAGAEGSISCIVHTDPILFLNHIPDDECLIAPIVDCQLGEDTRLSSGWFMLSVPFCENYIDPFISVWHGDIYTVPSQPFGLVPRASTSSMSKQVASFFTVQGDKIIIYTKKFSQFVCTSCRKVCHGQGQAFVFAKRMHNTFVGPVTSLRVYTGSPLYIIEDYREVSKPDIAQFHIIFVLFWMAWIKPTSCETSQP